MPDIRATPEQYPMIGALGRGLQRADEFARAPFGYENPPVQIASDFFRIPSLYRTLENVAYGSPLTRGTGQARQLTEDTTGAIEAGLNLLPVAAPLAKFMKGKPLGLSVKPVGNLNLRHSVGAVHLKGPEKQKVGDFLKQIKGMKGLTKEGKEMALAKLEEFKPDAMVTKEFVEESLVPSKFSKIDLKGAAEDAEAHLNEQAWEMTRDDPDYWYNFIEYMDVEPRPIFRRKLDQLHSEYRLDAQQNIVDDMVESAPELHAKLREIGVINDSGKFSPDKFLDLQSEYETLRYDHNLEFLRTNYEPPEGYTYEDYQRLTGTDYSGYPEGNYVEMGVSHPDAPSKYKHYEGASEPMVAHFRGTGDSSEAVMPIDDFEPLELDPNSFVIEELQSDAQKGIKQTGPLHQAHATAFKAAVQHALEQGHDTIYLPTAHTIGYVRNKPAASFAPIYDQEVIHHGLAPLSRIPGVSVEPINADDITAYHKMKFSPEARQEILEGDKGQAFPGFAAGGVAKFAGGGDVKKEKLPELRATPRSEAIGAIADAAQELHNNYLRKQFGFDNPVTEAISEFMGIPAFANMMNRLSYGESPIAGKGQTLKIKPWMVDGLMSLPAGAVAETGLRTIRSLPAALKHGATEFAKASGGARSQVIKPKGAQTLGNILDAELRDFKKRPMGMDPEQRLQQIEQAHVQLAQTDPNVVTPQYLAALDRETARTKSDVAINKWIEGPLRKYIMRDMGTVDDPVRKLAEEGIVHTTFDRGFAVPASHLQMERFKMGFPSGGVGESEAARSWDTMADYGVGTPYYSDSPLDAEMMFGDVENIPDWYKKLEPGTPVFVPQSGNLDFQHIIDVLSQDVTSGRIRPEQLSKISMEQAVRRAYEYDIEKAAQMEKAAVEEAGKHFPIHREYPNGFRWIELKAKPAATPDDLTAEAKSRYDQYMSAGADHDTSLRRANEHHINELTAKALENEGAIMGHCVGSYCDPVLSGEKSIYSLRDPKGRSHVTVEVRNPTRDDIIQNNITEYYEMSQEGFPFANRWADEQAAKTPRTIRQIKGKQNLAPIEDYQPYVADFVRSGQWNPQIGDFHYTDMVKVGDKYIRKSEFEKLMQEQGYDRSSDPRVTLDWMQRASRMDPSSLLESDQNMLRAIREFQPPEFKDGGSVDLRAHYFGS